MKKNSKNITALTLLLAASLLMSACNSSSLESTKTGEKESEETTEETEREETDATKEAEKDESEKTEATTEESEVTTEETTEETTTETSEETTEATTETSADKSVDDSKLPGLYASALDEILYHLSGNLAEEDAYSYIGIDEVAINGYYSENNVMDKVGYIFRDLNEDGTKELLVLDKSEYNDGYGYMVLAIFYLDNNTPKILTEGWARNQLYLLNDNTFLNYGSSGFAYQTISVFRYNEDLEQDMLYSFFTDYEDPDDRESIIRWYEKKGDEVIDHGPIEAYDPEYEVADFNKIEDFKPFSMLPHKYQAVVKDCTYEEAAALCEAMGGHLVTIKNPQEAAIVTALVSMNSEFGSFFVDPSCADRDFLWKYDADQSYDSYMVSISGEDGSLYIMQTSDDPVGENKDMSGFIGFICEIDY